MLKFKLRTLFLTVGGCAVLSLVLRLLYVVPGINAEKLIRTSPIQTIITRDPNGEISSNRVTYSIGQYGITEFGNIRLAVRGCPFSGTSSSVLSLANNFTSAGGGGSTGVGNRRFTATVIAGGSSCTFGGLSFRIVNGQLTLCGRQFDVDGPARVVIIGKAGKIEAVEKIPRTDRQNSAVN